MKLIQALFAATIVIFLFISCKKNKDDKAEACRMSQAVLTVGSHSYTYALSYDDQGRLASVQESSAGSLSLSVFEYTNNVIRITRAVNGTIYRIDSVVTNSNGMISYIKARSLAQESVTESMMTYNGTDLVTYTTITGGGFPSVENASFLNGNLMSMTEGSLLVTYSYYENENVQPGDFLTFAQYSMYGAVYIRNRSLMSSRTSGPAGGPPGPSGPSVETFEYNFDADGRITNAQLITGSSISQLNYTYECN